MEREIESAPAWRLVEWMLETNVIHWFKYNFKFVQQTMNSIGVVEATTSPPSFQKAERTSLLCSAFSDPATPITKRWQEFQAELKIQNTNRAFENIINCDDWAFKFGMTWKLLKVYFRDAVAEPVVERVIRGHALVIVLIRLDDLKLFSKWTDMLFEHFALDIWIWNFPFKWNAIIFEKRKTKT